MTPRVAAGVILVRGGEESLELLLVRRTPNARFMGGVWVFPGGALDPADGDGDAGLRAAAMRELRRGGRRSRCRHRPSSSRSRAGSRPRPLPIRFDTVFFVAHAPDDCEPAVDGEEMVDWRWIAPADALARVAAQEMDVAFPTLHDLDGLAAHASADRADRRSRATRPVFPTQPVVVIEDGTPTVVIPPRPDEALA